MFSIWLLWVYGKWPIFTGKAYFWFQTSCKYSSSSFNEFLFFRFLDAPTWVVINIFFFSSHYCFCVCFFHFTESECQYTFAQYELPYFILSLSFSLLKKFQPKWAQFPNFFKVLVLTSWKNLKAPFSFILSLFLFLTKICVECRRIKISSFWFQIFLYFFHL